MVNIYIFESRVDLDKDSTEFNKTVALGEIEFQVKIRLYSLDHELYGIIYRVLLYTEYNGFESKIHDWNLKSVYNSYVNGFLEKFLLRTIFSIDLTNKIL